jgi:hypothetical protein
MNTTPRTVELLSADGVAHGELTYGEYSSTTDSESCWVRLARAEHVLLGHSGDYFDALIDLRRQLEAQGTLIRVNGAGRNIWPSGMSRSMGAGIKAFRLSLGQQARMADLVHIFESSVGIEPVTIAEQEHFRDQWFASVAAG